VNVYLFHLYDGDGDEIFSLLYFYLFHLYDGDDDEIFSLFP